MQKDVRKDMQIGNHNDHNNYKIVITIIIAIMLYF